MIKASTLLLCVPLVACAARRPHATLPSGAPSAEARAILSAPSSTAAAAVGGRAPLPPSIAPAPAPSTAPATTAPPASPPPAEATDDGVLRPAVPAAPLRGPERPARADDARVPPPTSPLAPATPLPGSAAGSTTAPLGGATTPASAIPASRSSLSSFVWPSGRDAYLSALLARARTGAEPELTPVADLLRTIVEAAPTSSGTARVVRLPEIEAAERSGRVGGTAWSTSTDFLDDATNASAMRASFLDLDRILEHTGKPGTSLVSRRGDVIVGRTDAIRRILALELGARWTFTARSLDRGAGRLVVYAMARADDTLHMLATRGVLVVVPLDAAAPGRGLFVGEASAALVDFDVPDLLAGAAQATAKKEMLARIAGVRAHWREYAR